MPGPERHPSSVAVSREHRRAKTDRLDTELLKRGFMGWLRGERGHCSMARVPTIGIMDRVIEVGDPLPPFTLKNASGQEVRSEDLLATGPLVLTVFRGSW